MNQLRYILTAVFALMLVTIQAQGDLPTGEVDVVRAFEARLADAERVQVQPVLPPLDTTLRRQSYNIITRAIDVEYLPPTIRPRALRKEESGPVYNGYARLGAGFPRSFYGDVSYDLIDRENFDFGIAAFHHSANNDRNIENQRFSNTSFDLDGTYYFDQGLAVEAGTGYRTRSVYYYGYNEINEELDSTVFSFDPDDVRQRFNMFDIGARIFNGQRTASDFNYSAGFDMYILDDAFAARENAFDLRLQATKWFNDRNPLDILLRTDFTSYKDTSKQSLNNFYLMPSYTLHSDRFQLKLGFNLASSNDRFNFFPNVEATANIVEGVFGAFIGAEGSLQKNNLRSLSEYNPFIRTRVRIRNSRYNRFYGGLQGTILAANYRAEISYKAVDNLALFQLNDPLDSIPRFDVLYDTADVVSLQGTVVLPLFPGFELTGTVAQHFFSLEREEKAWHLPSFTVNTGLSYTTPDNRAIIRGDFFLENGVPYRSSEGEVDNLNALFDISMTGEYFFTDNIGAFITLNNMANNRRQRWYRYPTFGLNALFGITARF